MCSALQRIATFKGKLISPPKSMILRFILLSSVWGSRLKDVDTEIIKCSNYEAQSDFLTTKFPECGRVHIILFNHCKPRRAAVFFVLMRSTIKTSLVFQINVLSRFGLLSRVTHCEQNSCWRISLGNNVLQQSF